MKLKCLSFNFSNADALVKNALALHSNDITIFTRKIRDLISVSELFILSTCNRTEFYFVSDECDVEQVRKAVFLLLGIQRNPSKVLELHINETVEAAKHLFEVAVGVHSQILGDIQVISQVKEAYQLAADENFVGPVLHHVLHQAFHVNKRVVNETDFKKGASSVASAAVQLVGELVGKRTTPVLLLGAGQNSEDTLKNLLNSGFSDITICNRTYQKAASMAKQYSVKAEVFDYLPELIKRHTIIIASLNSKDYVVNSQVLGIMEIQYDFKYFIDLSVPSVIDRKIEGNPSNIVYGIEYMKERNADTLRKRSKQLKKVLTIIEEESLIFLEWFSVKTVTDSLKKYTEVIQKLHKEELQKCLFEVMKKQELLGSSSSISNEVSMRVLTQSLTNWKFVCQQHFNHDGLDELFTEVFDVSGLFINRSFNNTL